jgi:hypothetical protein
MRIGIDFDNTIVSYDALFHRVALERELIPADLPATKLSVRDHLREIGREDDWTEMQGYVYGARMDEALPYPGAIDFFDWARTERIDLAIVSHKTRHPILGCPYDLHEAARGWVRKFLIDIKQPLIDAADVYFEPTKRAKLARIAALDLGCFIDDLPEILLAAGFPERTSGLLFDFDGTHARDQRIPAFRSWNQLKQHIETLWTHH